jgi:hypothetical protein
MKTQSIVRKAALVALAVLPRLAWADPVALTVPVNTTWRSIGPVGDLTGQGINNVGLAWEAANVGWNTSLAFDDSDGAGWANAIEVVHPNPPFLRYWFDGNETVGSSPVYFRKVFNLSGAPISGLLNFSVDDDAQVYVNGGLVLNDSNSLATTVNNLNVAPYLHSGFNLIAVKAQDQQGAQGIAGSLNITIVPEPSSFVLAGIALVTVCVLGLRRLR